MMRCVIAMEKLNKFPMWYKFVPFVPRVNLFEQLKLVNEVNYLYGTKGTNVREIFDLEYFW